MRDIAEELKRSVSSISAEISTNNVNGEYDPIKANRKAYWKRYNAKYQGMKIVGSKKLRRFVDDYLYDEQSPTAISGRLKHHEKNLEYVSKTAIYDYIKSTHGRKVESFLKSIKPKRKSGPKNRDRLNGRVFIDKRPKYIQIRKRVGDAEADFIVSGRTGKGILLVLVDRKTRSAFLEQILSITTRQVYLALRRIKNRFPELKTMTLDNDILFQKHKELERLLETKIYFCDPYHSWQKGQVENTNKRIRRYIPKRSNISFYSRSFIDNIELKLNCRVMKCLKYRRPKEVLEEERRKRALGQRRHLA